jgi:hypothetical protein
VSLGLACVLAASLAACGDPLAHLEMSEWYGHVRLNAKDPFRHSWDFLRADYGGVLQDKEVRNAGQHLDYDAYYPGEFTVAIQGGEEGVIVDLGTDDELATRLGATQTVGGGQGFAALALEGARFGHPPADHVLDWSPGAADTSYTDHLPVKHRHVYLLRVSSRDAEDRVTELLVKLLVVKLETDIVEFEWVRLSWEK